MNKVYESVVNCYNQIRKETDFVPDITIVLGSGLGDFAESIDVIKIIDYKSIDHFPKSTVSGHKGRFVFGMIGDTKVAIMQGRVHYYEGYSITDVVLPIRVLKLMGAKVLFLTNAAGGIGDQLSCGDLMLITDHISSFAPNVLIGENIEEFGTRFPDMSEVYDKDLRDIILDVAKSEQIDLKQGVYVQATGPSFESPAEIKMFKTLGADAVGMSTVCEAIAANHMGMKICGISLISNMAAGINKKPLSHIEVNETADRTAHIFKRLVEKSVVKIGEKLLEDK